MSIFSGFFYHFDGDNVVGYMLPQSTDSYQNSCPQRSSGCNMQVPRFSGYFECSFMWRGVGRGNPSSAKPTFKEMFQKNTGTTPLPQEYSVDRVYKFPQLDLIDPLIFGIHDVFLAKSIICRFNGLWPKIADLFKWFYTS